MFQPPVITVEPQAKPSSQHRRSVELLRTRKGKRWIAWDESKVRNDLGETEIQSVGRLHFLLIGLIDRPELLGFGV